MAWIAIALIVATGLAYVALSTGPIAALTARWRAARSDGDRRPRHPTAEAPRASSRAPGHTPAGSPLLTPHQLATLHHEIRTPMNGLLGMTELLLHTDLDAEQHRLAEMLSASGLRLMVVVDELLERIETAGDRSGASADHPPTGRHTQVHGRGLAVARQPASRPAVLVIESDPLTRHVIMLSLEQAGCRVGVAADTAQALEVVDTERFDAIVVHCPTPAAEDLSASLRVRHGAGEAADIPIIMLAASAADDTDVAQRPSGIADHLIKASSYADLVASLRRHGVSIGPLTSTDRPADQAPLTLT